MIFGMASVGILEEALRADLYKVPPELVIWLVGAALVGTAGAMVISRMVWRRIHRLEPEEIASLLETHDAMLHGIGEGVVAVDVLGAVALVNDEARRLLGADDDSVASPATEVLGAAMAVPWCPGALPRHHPPGCCEPAHGQEHYRGREGHPFGHR
ncbi:hypothetical protein [Cryobacterium sp. N19]|uniref:hypothetical protein n=1 Tax=Cryobacterium sp. N19 TaxID=2048288 RepID=UPI001E47D500|nr:hypothetical protein [Cryobacterium sp. N19]